MVAERLHVRDAAAAQRVAIVRAELLLERAVAALVRIGVGVRVRIRVRVLHERAMAALLS